MKTHLTSVILIFSLILGQFALPSFACASVQEPEFHESSTELVFTASSRERYIGHLTLIAASLVSMFQIQRCKSPAISCGWSTAISAAAGVALLAGEIISIFAYKDILENLEINKAEIEDTREECLQLSAGKVNLKSNADEEVCSQLSSIIAQRDAYEGLLDYLNKSIWLKVVAGLAYLGSAGIELAAHSEAMMSDSAMVSSAAAAQASCTAFAAGPQAIACGESVARCEAALALFQGYMGKKMAIFNAPVPSPSMLQCGLVKSEDVTALSALQAGCAGCCIGNVTPLLAQAAKESANLNCAANPKSCKLGCQPPLPMSAINQKEKSEQKKWAQTILDAIFKKAMAEDQKLSANQVMKGLGPALSLGTYGVGIIITALVSQNYTGDTMFSTPMKRSIWYGAIGLLVELSVFHTNSAIDEVNGHITSLNNLLATAESVMPSVSTVGINPAGVNTVGENFEANAKVEYPGLDSLKELNCQHGGDGKSGCIAVPENLKAKLKKLNLNGITGMTSNIEDLSKEILDNKGSMKNAMELAKDISSNKNLVKKFVDAAKGKMLELQKANGVDALDYDEEVKKLADSMTKSFADQLDKDNKFASTKPINDKAIETSDEKIEETMVSDLTDDNKNIPAFENEVSDDLPAQTLTFNLSDNNDVSLIDDNENTRRGNVLTSKSLVSKGKSLFKAISLRYKKSGYPALLEEY